MQLFAHKSCTSIPPRGTLLTLACSAACRRFVLPCYAARLPTLRQRQRWQDRISSCLQDGSIHYNIQLTGELSTSLLSPGEGDDPRWGTLVAPRVNAQVTMHVLIDFKNCSVSSELHQPAVAWGRA